MQAKLPPVETALRAEATIGESPLWCAAEQALYWIDIKAPALHRFDPADGATRTWRLTSDVGAFALLRDPPGALVALRDGLHRLDFASGELSRLAPSPFDPAVMRFNEGACDETGRFWVGVMCDPLDGRPGGHDGALHSFTLEGGLLARADRTDLHNGMAWSPDGRIFYVSHSYERRIFAHPFDPQSARLGEARLLAVLEQEAGIPAGAAVDVEGGYWAACHGGGRLRRLRPDGAVDRDIPLPVSQPTMCAFGGPDLQDLYVTSARDGLGEAQLEAEPLAGSLLRLRPGVRVVARRTYADRDHR